jgi:hypothetical protein
VLHGAWAAWYSGEWCGGLRELVIRAGRFQTEKMPCLLGCLALSAPRFVLLIVWLCSNYLEWAYETKLWPVLGWIFMPLTTLAYAVAMHYGDHQWTPLGVALVVTAVLIDLGLIGTSSRARRRRGGGGGDGPGTPPREIVVEGRRVG